MEWNNENTQDKQNLLSISDSDKEISTLRPVDNAKHLVRVFPDAQISAFCRILNANVPHFAWQCAQIGAIFRFLRRFGSMSNSGNRRLNLHLVVDCNHPCDIDRFIWFPIQKSAGCDNSRERGTNIC